MGGLLVGVIMGGALSQMLVSVLTGVFDPPPAALAVPWGYLTLTAVIALGAIGATALLSTRRSVRPTVEYLRDL